MVLTEFDCPDDFCENALGQVHSRTQNGRVDIIDGAYKTAKRQRFAQYSDFTSNAYTTFFMRKENIDKYPLTNLQDIYKHKLRIGTQIGPLYASEFNQFWRTKNTPY